MDDLQNSYDLLNPIAKSRESDVFLVRQKDTSNLFLLKTSKQINHKDAEISNSKRNFREIEIVSSLDHPNIAKPYEAFIRNDTFSILYPYEKGDTLSRLFEIEQKFDEHEALLITKQLLEALSYIHSRNIIHCDINPQNIFITEAKGVKLLDFGLSLTEEDARNMPEGRITGTFPYLSPEQMGFTKFKIDNRTDLYCTMMLLYRMLAGTHPFAMKENKLKDLLDAAIKRELVAIKHVPKLLNMILIKGLKPTPSERYQTAEGLLADISFALDQINNLQQNHFIPGQKDAIAAINRKRIFVVRQDEIEQLCIGLGDVLNKKHRSLLIYGKSGIGKTEIVKEFKTNVDENKFDFISAKCNRFTPSQPYSIFRRLVLDLLIKISDSESDTAIFKAAIYRGLSDYSGIICQIIPEMREWFDSVKEIDIIEKEKESDRLLHVLSTFLSTLCSVRKLVIFIDDLQWVDKITFDVMKRALEQQLSCFVIFNYRTSENNDQIYNFSQNIQTLGFSKIIHIKPFTLNDTRILIARRFGIIKKSEELAKLLFEKTEGVPFVLSEAIRYLVNNSFLLIDADGWSFQSDKISELPVKFDVVSLILTKLNDLNHEEKRYLQIASLIEGKFDCDIVEKLGKLPFHSTNYIADRLESMGIISTLLKGGYTFNHDKVQESIASDMPPDEKYSMFEKLGEIYLDLVFVDKEKIFNAAECYLKSKNILKATEVCYQAATYASEKIAFDIALRYFKNSLLMVELGNKKGVKSVIDEIKVRMSMGDVLILIGANEQALSTFTKIDKETGSLLDSMQRLEVQYKIGTIYHNLGEFEKSAPCFIKALSEMGTQIPESRIKLSVFLVVTLLLQILYSMGLKRILPKRNGKLSILKARILNKLSYSLYFSDMLTAFYVHFLALNLADVLVDCYEKAEAYSSHQVPIYQIMMKKRSFRYLTKSIKISKKINRLDSKAFAESFGGVVNYYHSNWKKSEKILWDSICSYEKIGDISGQILNMEHIWKISFLQGTSKKTIANMEKTVDLCKRVNEKYYFLVTTSALNLMKLINNGIHDINEYSHVEKKLGDVNAFLFHIEAGGYLLQTEILLNQLERAYNRAKKMLPLILRKCINSEYQVRTYSLYCNLIVLELLNRLKGNPQINESSRKLKKDFVINSIILWFSCLSFPAYWGSFFRNVAWFFAIQRHNKIANILFKKAIKCHHKLDMRYEEACSIRDYGLFLDDFCNQPGKARDHFNIAYELFSWCGAKFETDKLESRIHPSIKRTDIIKSDTTIESMLQDNDTSASSDINQVRMDSLLEISSSMTEMEDMHVLLKQILSAMINATGAQYGCLSLNEYQHNGKTTSALSFEGEEVDFNSVSLFQKLIDKVNETKTIQTYEETLIEEAGTNAEDTSRSDMCVPLKWRDKYLGYVYLVNDKIQGLFGQGARKAAQILAGEAGIVLEHAHLMSQYRELNMQLQHKVVDQTNDLVQKHKQLEENTLKLIDSERMKNLLTGALVHDIKNYITAIQGNIKLFEMKFPANEKVKRTSTIVTNSCNDILNLTSNLLDIAKMEEGKFEVKKEILTIRQLDGIIQKCKTNDIFTQREISIEVQLPEKRFDIEADYELIDRVFQNLFSNAVKYSPKGGKIILSFFPGEKENIITFFNSGIPIPEGSKENIFEKYGRLNDKNSLYSKGLGLFFCRMVMNAHGGRIWVETDDKGNYFKLSFHAVNYYLLQQESDCKDLDKDKNDMRGFAQAG
jgi:serine/threonine protein kinase/signal transduction histidine kinase/tetratricopeptide (TPR) repeat protein